MDEIVTAAAVAVVVGGWAADALGPWAERARSRFREWREPTVVEKIHEEYATGEIGEAEMERRLSRALDPSEERIREAIRPIEGVGETRAGEIAAAFGSLEAVRRASVDELADVEHVGEKIAEKVRDGLN